MPRHPRGVVTSGDHVSTHPLGLSSGQSQSGEKGSSPGGLGAGVGRGVGCGIGIGGGSTHPRHAQCPGVTSSRRARYTHPPGDTSSRLVTVVQYPGRTTVHTCRLTTAPSSQHSTVRHPYSSGTHDCSVTSR